MSRSKIKILIVEDDVFLAAIYERRFEIDGFLPTVVADGETALTQIAAKQPHCILLDILLPKLNGIAVLQRLKADPVNKDIPVILLTNLGDKNSREQGLKFGAASYLIKVHFKPSEVVKKVKEVLCIN